MLLRTILSCGAGARAARRAAPDRAFCVFGGRGASVAAAAAASANRTFLRSAGRAAGNTRGGLDAGGGRLAWAPACIWVDHGGCRAFSSSAQRGAPPPPDGGDARPLDDPADVAARAAEQEAGPAPGAPPADATAAGPGTGTDAVADAIADHASDLAYVADLSWWSPPDLVVRLLDTVHATAGLEWWATIAATTVGLRVLLFPVMVKAMRGGAIMAQIKPELDAIKADLDKATTQDEQKVHQQRMKNLMTQRNFNPLSPFLPVLAQMPVFMSFFFGIRRMTDNMTSMETGGLLFRDVPFYGDLNLLDLTQPDTTYLMPALCAATFLMTIEVGGETGIQTEQQQKMKKFMRAFAVFMFVPMMYMPSGLFCYWLTSNVFTLGQTMIVKAPVVKEFFDIPKVTPPRGAGKAGASAWSGFDAPPPPPPPGNAHAAGAGGVVDVGSMLGPSSTSPNNNNSKRETPHQRRRRRKRRRH